MTQPTNFFTTLPNELITHIASFCDPKSQNQLSETNSKIKTVVDDARETLALTIPWGQSRWREDQIGSTHPMTLVRLVNRFPNITRISLADPCLASNYATFTEYHADIVRPLISFLQTNYPKNLSHVKLREIEWKSFGGDHSQATQLTRDWFNVFGHPQTLSLEIANHHNGSVITSEIINSMLEKSENLISFTFNGFQFSSDISLQLHLSKCPKLEKVRLRGMPAISDMTIAQIGLCRNLTELSVDKTWKGAQELEQFLCTNHGLKLRVLDLEDTRCLSTDETLDLATKHLTDLEFFSRNQFCTHQNRISDAGFIQLANNCKRLTTLIFNFENITDEGISAFALSAPQLRKLSTYQMYRVTHQGVCALAQHCKKLEALELIHFSDLNPAILAALAKNCENLQFLSISNCRSKDITLQDLRAFVSSCKSLKYLDISSCDGIPSEAIEALRKEFPHIRKPAFRAFYSI